MKSPLTIISHTHSYPRNRFREYGLHTIDLQRLSGDVVGVRARKLKTRLVVALVKGGRRGSYSHRPAWSKLQAALEKPSD